MWKIRGHLRWAFSVKIWVRLYSVLLMSSYEIYNRKTDRYVSV
jgi:hypothetical protein